MRLVRNIFYVSGALIGTGVLLYVVLTLAAVAGLGGFQADGSSLPGPLRLAAGASTAVTPDCSITLAGTGGMFPDHAYARIRGGSLGSDGVRTYRVGDRIVCSNFPGRSILAQVDAIDLAGAHFTFQWGP